MQSKSLIAHIPHVRRSQHFRPMTLPRSDTVHFREEPTACISRRDLIAHKLAYIVKYPNRRLSCGPVRNAVVPTGGSRPRHCCPSSLMLKSFCPFAAVGGNIIAIIWVPRDMAGVAGAIGVAAPVVSIIHETLKNDIHTVTPP